MLITFFGSLKKKITFVFSILYNVQCTYISFTLKGWIRIHIIKDIYLPHRSSCSSPFSLFSTLFYIFFCQSACTKDLFLCICLCLSPSLYFAAFSYIFFCLNFSVFCLTIRRLSCTSEPYSCSPNKTLGSELAWWSVARCTAPSRA